MRAAEQGLDRQGDGKRPDIVIVQSESLFSPSQLCGFSDTPVLKHIAQQQPKLPGNLEVPVFGGRTLQTEFEVLSGAPIAYYPGSMFAYYELVNHRFNALPRVLDGDGYKTIAIHPNNRGFWRRDIAFPDMGFESFQDIHSFVYPRDFSDRNFVSDEALTRAILAELDSSNRATFVMAISMNNHGPWGAFAPVNDSGLELSSKLHGKARTAMADYVEHAIDADNAYGFLLDALQRRGRPTVVVIYGDHMPALPRVYKQLCFKNGKSAEEHYPPYRIWANFPMPKPPDVTSAYLLQGWLMLADADEASIRQAIRRVRRRHRFAVRTHRGRARANRPWHQQRGRVIDTAAIPRRLLVALRCCPRRHARGDQCHGRQARTLSRLADPEGVSPGDAGLARSQAAVDPGRGCRFSRSGHGLRPRNHAGSTDAVLLAPLPDTGPGASSGFARSPARTHPGQ